MDEGWRFLHHGVDEAIETLPFALEEGSFKSWDEFLFAVQSHFKLISIDSLKRKFC